MAEILVEIQPKLYLVQLLGRPKIETKDSLRANLSMNLSGVPIFGRFVQQLVPAQFETVSLELGAETIFGMQPCLAASSSNGYQRLLSGRIPTKKSLCTGTYRTATSTRGRSTAKVPVRTHASHNHHRDSVCGLTSYQQPCSGNDSFLLNQAFSWK